MTKCTRCGIDIQERTCIFATYALDIGGKEMTFCCERCAKEHGAENKIQ